MITPMVQPYLFFGGRCEEALEFYRTALGAQVDFLMRYQESPEPMPAGMVPPGFENKIMHTLADGGQVRMPLAKTFWSPCFGMVADRFGLLWMISIEAAG